MKWLTGMVLAAATLFGGSVAQAQSGDPDRLFQQAALGHASVIESAWLSVARRIEVTDAASPPGIWDTEWNGISDPPVGSWWLAEWTQRGLTARYCAGVLAVYAARDELKGTGRDQVSVQIAPTVYSDGEKRSGLHRIVAGSRQYKGAWGRDDGVLPSCMPIVSSGQDRVALVVSVANPRRTAAGIRWENRDRTVACPVATDSGDIIERRRIPIQVTPVAGCTGANCEDLAQQAGIPPAWPADCAAREAAFTAGTIEEEALCTDWAVWRNSCKATFQTAGVTVTPLTTATPPTSTGNPVTQSPVALPNPRIVLRPAPDQTRTENCGCGANEEGSCTEYWARSTVWRDFYLRPGATAVTTRIVDPNNPGWRLTNTVDTCTPIRRTSTPIDVDGDGNIDGYDNDGDGNVDSTSPGGHTSTTGGVPEQDTVSDPGFTGGYGGTDGGGGSDGSSGSESGNGGSPP